MASIKLHDTDINTNGVLPIVGVKAPNFKLVNKDLEDFGLSDFPGKKIVLNIFPSVDTPICARSIIRFNKDCSEKEDVIVICVSKDLPFAQNRFCGAEGLINVIMGSEYRNTDFSDHYHVSIIDGPLRGLFSRAVVVLDEKHHVLYSEQVREIAQEPNYEAALAVL